MIRRRNKWQSRSIDAVAGLMALAVISPAPLASQSAPQNAAMIDYNREVHAILAARCLVCHSQEKRSGGLSLATYQDVLNGGRRRAAGGRGAQRGGPGVAR